MDVQSRYRKVATIMYTSISDASRGVFLVYKLPKDYIILRKHKTQRDKEEITLIDWESFIESYFNVKDKKQFKVNIHFLDKEFEDIIQMRDGAEKI